MHENVLIDSKKQRNLNKPLTESQKILYWTKMAQHMADVKIQPCEPDISNRKIAERIAQELFDPNL